MIDYYEPNSSNQKHFLYMFPGGEVKRTLRKRYPYSELFWSAFSSHFPRIFPHSDWIWSGKIGKAGKSGKNADQNNSEYGLFLRSGILHIEEGKCEWSIKLFLENRTLLEKVCTSSQFRVQRKEEEKQETKYDQIINSIPTLLIPSYGYHSTCCENFTATSKPKIKPQTSIQHDQKIYLHYYHLQLEYYLLYVYFLIKEGKIMEFHGKKLEKMKNMKLK